MDASQMHLRIYTVKYFQYLSCNLQHYMNWVRLQKYNFDQILDMETGRFGRLCQIARIYFYI